MSAPVLVTKLYAPLPRPGAVPRPRLLARLDAGLRGKLTLVAAPAGYGKTALVGAWVANCCHPVAWLSLDAGERDPTRFLHYLVAALRTIAPDIGASVVGALQSPRPPTEALLAALLNELAALPDETVLVLDDYHLIDAKPIDEALSFLIEHLPPRLHLIVATREDPPLPLARLRARGHLTELRAADLRFTTAEAAEFLNAAMGLDLAAADVAALETRTEGWIAGLQLAALSMQGRQDVPGFIRSFTGGHHFVLDYLVEEVLQRQPASVQAFLLRTSILNRLCGPLCDAILRDPAASGQATLEHLERANLFLVPLDDERRWYRYHHLFAELLRQRLHQSAPPATAAEGRGVAELHVRASQWHEDHGLELDAFHHAAAANDVERAERLIEGGGMPLHFRGAVAPVLRWLASLPTTILDTRPSLWVLYASVSSMAGQLPAVEPKLHAAEAALHGSESDDKSRNMVGHIAAIRALLAATQNQAETVIAQSRRALEYLHPDNLAVRTATTWKLGWAYQLQGDRAAASRAYTEAIASSQASGNTAIIISATIGLGNIQEAETQLYPAAETYRRVLHMVGELPLPAACEAHLGLARICYEWNDLDVARQHAQQSVRLARQIENTASFITGEVLLARLKLAQGDVAGASAMLAQANQPVRQQQSAHHQADVAAAKVLALLDQGDLAAATALAQTHELPISQARVHLAQGDPSAALAVLEPLRLRADAKGWADERLKVLALQAVAHHTQGAKDEAARLLGDALALAQPNGFIRSFVDEGRPMARLLSAAAARGMMPDYTGTLLAAFDAEAHQGEDRSSLLPARHTGSPIEPLSRRELEVLHLIAQGLSNREIGEQLFLALDTVKGHNRGIFGKLRVQRRTEAVAKARAFNLLPPQ